VVGDLGILLGKKMLPALETDDFCLTRQVQIRCVWLVSWPEKLMR
jgi:hypothetical protein